MTWIGCLVVAGGSFTVGATVGLLLGWRPIRDPPDWAHGLAEKLDTLLTLARASQHTEGVLSMDLATILQKVTDLDTVEASMEALLSELSTELKAALANSDQTALQAIADKLDAEKQKMIDAVTANTPAAPAAAA